MGKGIFQFLKRDISETVMAKFEGIHFMERSVTLIVNAACIAIIAVMLITHAKF